MQTALQLITLHTVTYTATYIYGGFLGYFQYDFISLSHHCGGIWPTLL